MKTKKLWFNGKLIDWNRAKVHILNHSLHYGTGVFEGIRAYNTSEGPAVFRLPEHIERLYKSASVLKMKIPYSKKEIENAVLKTIKANNLKECYIRPIIFFGEKMGLLPTDTSLNFAIAAWKWGKYLEKENVSVKISKVMRIHPQSSIMTAKISGHYVNSILASFEAKKKNFDEALLLDSKGNITEGPGENVFFVKGKYFLTPKKGSILPGITRDSVMKIVKDLGYEIKEKNIKKDQLKNFDEAFFTGTAVEITPIKKIDNIKYRTTETGQKIRDIYLKIVKGEVEKYNKWLCYVK